MMGGKSRRPAPSSSGNQERVRTHLFFGQHNEQKTAKRKRRTHNKLHVTHKKDEMVQAGSGEVDPSEWTGNQRVLHYGPMAQRDPYFYYYPKGWDVLYPANFGFFPYRTDKFRGSSSMVCTCAFGVFLLLGGGLMIYLGFFSLYDSPFWTWPEEQRSRPPPIQFFGALELNCSTQPVTLLIAGPILFITGLVLILLAGICTFATSSFFKMYLHHTRHHDNPSRLTTITTTYRELPPLYECEPMQRMPPPAYPVVQNPYAHSSVVRPHDERKLYPPVIPNCSTLSLHGLSPSTIFVASPYNTLRATSVARFSPDGDRRVRGRTGSVASHRSSDTSGKRSKSMGPLHRTPSARRKADRENSQL